MVLSIIQQQSTLWKYENYLEGQGKSGYSPTRFEKIVSPELEHIAPQTENPGTGYDKYDEEFTNPRSITKCKKGGA